MAIQISGTTVIDNSRNITNVLGVGDTATTVYYGDGSNLSGVGGGIPVELLVVGGGGGGAPYSVPVAIGGGGGAGQYIHAQNYNLSPGETYTITIGAGGGVSSDGNSTTIADSSPTLVFDAIGGGGGGANSRFGGSGGGGNGTRLGSPTLVRHGLSPGPHTYTDNGALVSVKGFPSPLLLLGPGVVPASNGGGSGGTNGSGTVNSITGSPVTYAEGGAGGGFGGGPAPGPANSGDGGPGGKNPSPYSPPASVFVGSSGGSGVVIIKYPNSYPTAPASPGATFTPTPTHRIYTFNSSGSITLG